MTGGPLQQGFDTSLVSRVAWMQLSQVNLSKDKGPIAGYGQIDFTNGITPQTLDAAYPEQKGYISAIAGMFVDNADNAFPLIIRMSGTQQRLIVPALSQALLPLISKSPEQITFDSPGASVIVPIQFLNFRPGSPLVWGARAGGGSPSAPMYVSALTILNMTWGNTALLGGDQTIIPNGVALNTVIVKAPATNSAPFWLNWGAAAAANTQMQIDPGDYINLGSPGNLDNRALHVAGTAGDRINYGYV